MFCPICKTEYRPGFTRCSDCHVDLVPELPAEAPEEQEESAPLWPDAETMSELWRGEDTVLHGRLLSELKQAGIPCETEQTREAAGCGLEPIARGVEPRFGFIVRVQPQDRPSATVILYKLREAENVDFSIPVDTSAAFRISQNKTRTGLLTPVEDEEDESQELKCVWEGNDASKRDFVRASLRENGLVTHSTFQGQNYRILVGEAAQARAIETIKEIVEGMPPSFEPASGESRDEASFLKVQLLFCSIVTAVILYVVLLILLTFLADSPLAKQLPAFLEWCAVLGAVWTVYQALRYEQRPGPYLLMAIVPFSFVWYYFGRYKPRNLELAGPPSGRPRD